MASIYKEIASYCFSFKYTNVCILGLGISNLPLIDFIRDCGALGIYVLDRGYKDEARNAELVETCEKLKEKGKIYDYYVGEDYLSKIIEDTDIIMKSPSIRYDLPELLAAKQRGTCVTSEMEEFLKVCPAKTFCVTGSDGKTTTTTLIHKILSDAHKNDGVKIWLGGNIGMPLLSHIREIRDEDYVVLELSSFQLMNTNPSPDVSVITNITPNHLDVHRDYDEYIRAKKSIMLGQLRDSVTVLNADNEVTAEFGHEVFGERRMFSFDNEVQCGAYVKDGAIWFRPRAKDEYKVVDIADIKLPGRHNVENYMAAISATLDYVSVQNVVNVAKNFGGVEHRLEFVRELDGVKYYNSSIDSSPNRTMKALSVFNKKNIVLLAGGKDKKIPYDDLGPSILRVVKAMVLTGPTAALIEESARNAANKAGVAFDIPVIMASSYEEAVSECRKAANSGDIVLCSPASTSFDMFRNFEERGNIFKKLVNELK